MYLEEDLFEKRTKQQRAKDGGRLLSKERGCVNQAWVQHRIEFVELTGLNGNIKK